MGKASRPLTKRQTIVASRGRGGGQGTQRSGGAADQGAAGGQVRMCVHSGRVRRSGAEWQENPRRALTWGERRRRWWFDLPSMTLGARRREAAVDAGVAQLVEAVDSPLQSPPFGRESQTEQHPEPWALIGSINRAVSIALNLHADWRRHSAQIAQKARTFRQPPYRLGRDPSHLTSFLTRPLPPHHAPPLAAFRPPVVLHPPLPPSPPLQTVRSFYILNLLRAACPFFIVPAYPPPVSHLRVPTATLAKADYPTTPAPRSLSTAARTSPLPCCFQSTRTSLQGCRARRTRRPPARSLPACRKGREFTTPQYRQKL